MDTFSCFATSDTVQYELDGFNYAAKIPFNLASPDKLVAMFLPSGVDLTQPKVVLHETISPRVHVQLRLEKGPLIHSIQLSWHKQRGGPYHRSADPALIRWERLPQSQSMYNLVEVTRYEDGVVGGVGPGIDRYECVYDPSTGYLVSETRTYYKEGRIGRSYGLPARVEVQYGPCGELKQVRSLIIFHWYENGKLGRDLGINAGLPASIALRNDNTVESEAWYKNGRLRRTIKYTPNPDDPNTAFAKPASYGGRGARRGKPWKMHWKFCDPVVFES